MLVPESCTVKPSPAEAAKFWRKEWVTSRPVLQLRLAEIPTVEVSSIVKPDVASREVSSVGDHFMRPAMPRPCALPKLASA